MGMLPASPSIEEAVNPGKPVVQSPYKAPVQTPDGSSHDTDSAPTKRQ